MKKLICTFSITLLALRFATGAETATVEETPTPEVPAATEPRLEVKNKSAFKMDESGRNPFWPIGWKPVAKTSTSTGVEHTADISPNAFLVSSITVDAGARFAIINGKVMSEGQIFGLQVGNQTYQLTLKAIQDGQVVLGRRDQEIVVPLHRR